MGFVRIVNCSIMFCRRQYTKKKPFQARNNQIESKMELKGSKHIIAKTHSNSCNSYIHVRVHYDDSHTAHLFFPFWNRTIFLLK